MRIIESPSGVQYIVRYVGATNTNGSGFTVRRILSDGSVAPGRAKRVPYDYAARDAYGAAVIAYEESV